MVARQIGGQHDFAYRLVGFVDDGEGVELVRQHESARHGGRSSTAIIAEHHVDRIIVGLSDRRGRLPIEELLQAKLSGVRVEDATTTYERLTGKILIDDLKPSWLIFSDGFRASRLTRFVKRMLDLSLSMIGVHAGGAADGADGAGHPARLGRPGALQPGARRRERPHLHRLQVPLDAHRRGAGRPAGLGARRATTAITRVGRFIRATRLDELPQLWNVMRGDMSFVGPRPERPFFVEQLAREIPFYLQRHAVKPGLTGWAQVKYQYGSSIEDATEKLRYDLYYIKHMSIVFDLTIVLDTVKVILFGKGAK